MMYRIPKCSVHISGLLRTLFVRTGFESRWGQISVVLFLSWSISECTLLGVLEAWQNMFYFRIWRTVRCHHVHEWPFDPRVVGRALVTFDLTLAPRLGVWGYRFQWAFILYAVGLRRAKKQHVLNHCYKFWAFISYLKTLFGFIV